MLEAANSDESWDVIGMDGGDEWDRINEGEDSINMPSVRALGWGKIGIKV